MIPKIINFCRAAFPFFAVLILWRLMIPFWNPGGILAIIPIFFCSFIRPVRWFVPFSVIFCFLIDYRFDTLLLWTVLFLFTYAITGFQNIIDMRNIDRNGLGLFACFIAVALIIMTLVNFKFAILARGLWLMAWCCVLYFPITELIKRVCDDR